MNVTFGCRTISLKKILKCSFEINDTEYAILSLLLNKKSCSSKEISSNVDKDLSTVQRNIKSLYEKELVTRRQFNLDKGGYVYVYSSIPRDELKALVKEKLDNFVTVVLGKVEKL